MQNDEPPVPRFVPALSDEAKAEILIADFERTGNVDLARLAKMLVRLRGRRGYLAKLRDRLQAIEKSLERKAEPEPKTESFESSSFKI